MSSYKRTPENRAVAVPSLRPVKKGLLQRACACGEAPGISGDCKGCEKKRLQRQAGDQNRSREPSPDVRDVLRSPGQPLDAATRKFFEPRLGHDFSRVRIHTDEQAAASARNVDALAYTLGENIVFDSGQYVPTTLPGRRLLAHELAHVVQQNGAIRFLSHYEISNPTDPSEQDAERAAQAVMENRPAPRLAPVAAQVHRDVGWAQRGRDPYGTVESPWVEPTAPGQPAQTPPVGATKKKITVNITTLSGATRNATAALTYANTKVYNQADIEIVKGKELALDETKSKAILGNDLILHEYKTPSKPTDEEKALFKQNQTKGAVTMYFVKGQSDGSTGEAFWSSLGLGFIGFVNNNSSNDITFSHELGHVLLDDGGHTVPDDTYLMYESKNETKFKLTPAQIATIKGSSFAK